MLKIKSNLVSVLYVQKTIIFFFFAVFSMCLAWWCVDGLFGVFTGVNGVGFLAHKSCIEFVDKRGIFDFINLKVLCTYQSFQNVSRNEKEFLTLFANLGLIHLLVASGTHLLIIQTGVRFLLKPFTTSQRPIHLLLFCFVVISDFCIPVARCFVQLLVSNLSRQHSMGWSHINTTVLGSFIYLLLFPSAIQTISFWLSLSASLCLANFSRDTLCLSIVFFVGLLPFIYDFSQPSLSSILVNIVITPLLGPFLILNSLLYTLFPPYVPISDWLMMFIFSGLKAFSFLSDPATNPNYFSSTLSKITYGGLFCFTCLIFQKLRSRSLRRSIENEIK